MCTVEEADVDVVHPMSIETRVHHLISGYTRLNYADLNEQTIITRFPAEIIQICIHFAGIDQKNHYNLIKSRTELASQEEFDNEVIRYFREFTSKGQLPTFHPHPDIGYPSVTTFLLGAGAVGKTALFNRFCQDEFYEDYHPTIEDCLMKQVMIDDSLVDIEVYDLSGYSGEEWYRREELMRRVNVFIFVYSITSNTSFAELEWMIEKVHREKDEDLWFGIVAGNKCDLEFFRQVSTKEAEEFVMKYPNLKFFETSAKEGINHELIFIECARWCHYACDLSAKIEARRTQEAEQCNCQLL